MKAKKYFILVSENLKSSFYKTEKSVKINLEKQPFQKKFTFDNEKEAIKFQQDLAQCKGAEKFQQLEFDYVISQKLKQYEQKILSSKTFRVDDVFSDGVSINLRRSTHIYVLWDKNSKPQIYFSGVPVKRNQKPETETKQFLEPSEALAYIRQILEFLEKNRIQVDDGKDDEDQNQEQTDAYQKTPFFQNEEAKLFSLDQQYKHLLTKNLIDSMKEIKIDHSQEYAFRCSSFNTLHFHSAIGVSLINLISDQIIKSQGAYVSQRKPSGLLLLSVLFGLRYSIFLQIPSITFQIPIQQDYLFLNKMTKPSQPLQLLTLDAINNYSGLMKSVKYQLVESLDCQEAYRSAVKAFQKFAYMKERSKKFRPDKSSD